MKVKGRIEKEVINLYLTVVNGTPTESAAVVQYRTHSGGGVAVYHKEGNQWVLVNSHITIMQ